MGRLVLMAQSEDFTRNFQATIGDYIKDKGKLKASDLSTEELTVATHDGTLLNTFEINYQHSSVSSPNEERYIINFVGNAQCYESAIDDMEEDARHLKCTSIGFNHRGVSRSSSRPVSSDDLVTDGIAQVQRLLDKGVDAENITLKGFSLGGGIAVLVAKHFHDHGLKVNVFNDRSFSSMTNVVVGWIRRVNFINWTGHMEHWGMK